MPGEFELIRRHFTRPTRHTVLGVGDDAALMQPRAGMQIVVSTDMLVSGTHFFADADPAALGWKAAAVNISDMAAMGAEARWILLSISLPANNEQWVAALADGFARCCEQFGVDWVGGDTTRGPLNLCPTVIGEVPAGAAIVRSGAKPGDDIWVSGWPGLAALGLRHLRDGLPLAGDWRERCLLALHQPQPRVALSLALRGLASAMQDVSDGLLGDLAHILAASSCGAIIDDAALPLLPVLNACNDSALARESLLSGGDDYELVFTAPAAHRAQITVLADDVPLWRIGACTPGDGVRLRQRDGSLHAISAGGFDHFK